MISLQFVFEFVILSFSFFLPPSINHRNRLLKKEEREMMRTKTKREEGEQREPVRFFLCWRERARSKESKQVRSKESEHVRSSGKKGKKTFSLSLSLRHTHTLFVPSLRGTGAFRLRIPHSFSPCRLSLFESKQANVAARENILFVQLDEKKSITINQKCLESLPRRSASSPPRPGSAVGFSASSQCHPPRLRSRAKRDMR